MVFRGKTTVPRKILVSAQMGIGNLIMFLPFLRTLRFGYPEAKIVAVFSDRNGADEVLTTLSPGVVDKVVHLDLKNTGGLGRMWSGVRLGVRGWDMAVFRFNGFKREVMTAAVVGRARWRVGHAASPDWHNRWTSFLNVPVVMRPGDHEVDRYLQLAAALGLPPVERQPHLHLPADALRAVNNKIPALAIRESTSVVMSPGSSAAQSWKRWPADLWTNLACRVSALGILCIFMGSKEESGLIQEIIDAANIGARALNTAGQLSLLESAALARECSTVVCCDTAIMHIAAAVGTPVVGIFGPTDDQRTGPFGQGHVLLRSPECKGGCFTLQNPDGYKKCDVEKCMRGVSVDMVLSAILGRIGSVGRNAKASTL